MYTHIILVTLLTFVISNVLGQQFDHSSSGNVTAILGKPAILNCRVRGIGNKTVAWIRQKDAQVPTVGRYTFTSDERLSVIHEVLSDDYSLQILSVKKSDAGFYGCQISTTPVMTLLVYLSVAEPVTEIVGGPDIYIKEGVTMNNKFDHSSSGNVTAILGKPAILNCRVRGIGNKTVTWIRHKDAHILTAGRYTYTSDERFRAIHKVLSEEYSLQILYVKKSDAGLYECQVSTTPVMKHTVYLSVAEPVTEIVGGPDIYIEEGVTMNITCLVKNSPEPPQYIFWYHDEKLISYDFPRDGVSQITEEGDTTILLIQLATISDSGTYQCQPSNGNKASATVHVIRGPDPENLLTSQATERDTFGMVGNLLLSLFNLCVNFL